jgi:hypothetical protein
MVSQQILEQICKARPSYFADQKQYTTCGTTCAKKLITDGAPPRMCDVGISFQFVNVNDPTFRIVLS